MCVELILSSLSPLLPPAPFIDPAVLQLHDDDPVPEDATEDDFAFVNSTDDDVTSYDGAGDDFDEDSRSAQFADNGSASSSVFDDNPPSEITLRSLRGERCRKSDGSVDDDANQEIGSHATHHATPENVGNNGSTSSPCSNDVLSEAQKFDYALCQITDRILHDKKLSKFDFDRITDGLSFAQQCELENWRSCLDPTTPKEWKIWLFPNCPGPGMGDVKMCVTTSCRLLARCESTRIQFFPRYGVQCNRHRRRESESAQDKNDLWCMVQWPECTGDPLGGLCCRLLSRAAGDMALGRTIMCALKGQCEEHQAEESDDDDENEVRRLQEMLLKQAGVRGWRS
ncbi:uncharacterized protein Z519_12117 [Cladophialophora bantiana CBS 173.52]|uniref:Uncharacterized protein n=1 Tax=Cladophialophora bantiana (strain ATCC 10958 / CBS 173.52 / CDC B-1940 / NIH 8579) TaxID=1442370 RepID=A0A0D2HS62_CLAB1|nr:uncharacterized protein Z519_12117 [Cladophialophora bantiana CBS 173.52]KIW87214.1 hypothetical protein Z519_12117 [Cladophialophora bantiana CBS 173.52]